MRYEIRFSISFGLTEPVRNAILAMPESAWVPAITQAGEEREGTAVCQLADLDLFVGRVTDHGYIVVGTAIETAVRRRLEI